MKLTTQKEIRSHFWASFPDLAAEARSKGTLSKGQNSQTATCRSAFCDFVDGLRRSGIIAESLANRVTL